MSTATSTVSPKVVVATLVGTLAPALLACLQYLQTPEGQILFQALPPWLVPIIGGLITGGSVFIAGYIKRDPLRRDATPRRAAEEDIKTAANYDDSERQADEDLDDEPEILDSDLQPELELGEK